MCGRVTASPLSYDYSVCSPPLIIGQRHCSVKPRASRGHPSLTSNLKLFSSGFRKFPRISFSCNSTDDSGENGSKTILDAFFLGKAVAEALNERIESAMGEFLSTIGRLQAEQQKQIQEFQEEVLEKARRAKEQAAREALEAQGLIQESSPVEISAVNGVASNSSSAADSVNSVASSLQSNPSNNKNNPTNED